MSESSNDASNPSPYPDALGVSLPHFPPPRTLDELLMVIVSASIRADPDWWKKYTDPEIRAQWREGALNVRMVWIERETMLVPMQAVPYHLPRNADGSYYQGTYRLDESTVKLSETEVDYVLDELDGYAKLRDEGTGIEVSCFDGIWHSDRLISNELCSRLKTGVSILEDIPESNKDWRSGSDKQVLDLVHPSLYCGVYDRTLVVPRMCEDSTETRAEPRTLCRPMFAPYHAPLLFSDIGQWLPTDFSISAGDKVKALGYINNLHPSHSSLYSTIEDILGAFVLLFEHVLTDLLHPLPQRIPGDYLHINEVDPGFPQNEDDEDYNDQLDAYFSSWEENKIVSLPQLPQDGYTGGLEKREEIVSLRGRTVQVIVKLLNIYLTPEKPEYNSGQWQLQGLLDEHIVLSGLYYYDQENIAQSGLAFRIAVDEPEMAKKILGDTYDRYAHYRTWGMMMNDIESTMLNNVVGATATTKGRCLAFPNTYQHRVTIFRLSDPSKPGYRKILAFFLVDPNLVKPIPSTSTVPPQQRTWITQALREGGANTLFNRLPLELRDEIVKQTNPEIMSEKEAKEIELEDMEDRKELKMAAATEPVEWNHLFAGGTPFSRVFNMRED